MPLSAPYRGIGRVDWRKLINCRPDFTGGEHVMGAVAHEDWPIETWRPGVETRMLISALNGASGLCLFEQWIAPGAGAPTHGHPVEEVLTVVAGQAEMWIDDERFILTGNQSLIVPKLRQHGFANVGGETLHIRAVLASAAFDASFDGAAEATRRWAAAPVQG